MRGWCDQLGRTSALGKSAPGQSGSGAVAVWGLARARAPGFGRCPALPSAATLGATMPFSPPTWSHATSAAPVALGVCWLGRHARPTAAGGSGPVRCLAQGALPAIAYRVSRKTQSLATTWRPACGRQLRGRSATPNAAPVSRHAQCLATSAALESLPQNRALAGRRRVVCGAREIGGSAALSAALGCRSAACSAVASRTMIAWRSRSRPTARVVRSSPLANGSLPHGRSAAVLVARAPSAGL